MRSQLLTIEVARLQSGGARLHLTGALDFDTAHELVDAADELRRDGRHELEIDLGGVDLCDSSGLSALVMIHRAGPVPFRLTGANAQVQQLLDRTGLSDVLAAPATGAVDLTHAEFESSSGTG